MTKIKLMAGLVALCFVAACATFETNTGKTIASITTTVEAARKSWVDYVTTQRTLIPNPADRQDLEAKVFKVGVAYAQYQQSMRAANAALTSYHSAPTDQTALKTALNAVTAASGELIALINSAIATPK